MCRKHFDVLWILIIYNIHTLNFITLHVTPWIIFLKKRRKNIQIESITQTNGIDTQAKIWCDSFALNSIAIIGKCDKIYWNKNSAAMNSFDRKVRFKIVPKMVEKKSLQQNYSFVFSLLFLIYDDLSILCSAQIIVVFVYLCDCTYKSFADSVGNIALSTFFNPLVNWWTHSLFHWFRCA